MRISLKNANFASKRCFSHAFRAKTRAFHLRIGVAVDHVQVQLFLRDFGGGLQTFAALQGASATAVCTPATVVQHAQEAHVRVQHSALVSARPLAAAHAHATPTLRVISSASGWAKKRENVKPRQPYIELAINLSDNCEETRWKEREQRQQPCTLVGCSAARFWQRCRSFARRPWRFWRFCAAQSTS